MPPFEIKVSTLMQTSHIIWNGGNAVYIVTRVLCIMYRHARTWPLCARCTSVFPAVYSDNKQVFHYSRWKKGRVFSLFPASELADRRRVRLNVFPLPSRAREAGSGSSASLVGPPPVCLFPKHLLTHALPLVSLSEVAAPRRKERPASRLVFRTAAASLERSPSHEIFMSTCSPVHGRTLTNTNAPRARTRCVVVVGLFTLEEKSSWSWQMEPLP